MTDRERAIVMAYTGTVMLAGDKFSIFHEYVEEIMSRPVWTHEMGINLVAEEIKEKAKPDFLELCANGSEEEKNLRFELTTASGKNPQKYLQREIEPVDYDFETHHGTCINSINTIVVETLEDLIAIREEAGKDIILGKTYHTTNPCKYELTIYDDYIE